MTQSKRPRRDGESPEVHETVYRARRIRIERPSADAAERTGREAGRLFIDDEEIPVEFTEGGVIPHHDMAFKEYGSLDEAAEDIIRQRGSAQIERGETLPPPHPH